MNFSETFIKEAAKQNNIENFKKSEYYRCYYCCKKLKTQTLFDAYEKDDGCVVMDNRGVCFCQHCGVDSIIPESDLYDINNDDFIWAMGSYYFHGYQLFSKNS